MGEARQQVSYAAWVSPRLYASMTEYVCCIQALLGVCLIGAGRSGFGETDFAPTTSIFAALPV
jgi:hypothetical protein